MQIAWPRLTRFTQRSDGNASTFLLCLQSSQWLPPDDLDAEDLPLRRPGELVSGTAEVRSVFPDAQLLRGRLTRLSGAFAEALGVATRPSLELAFKVLQSFGSCSPVAPESAAAVYSFLEEQGADLEALRHSACVVVASKAPAELPCDVVWEDAHGACALPTLQRLYSARWRHFFVKGLGVPESPTPDQVLRRIDQLSVAGDAAKLWPCLLLVAEKLEEEAWRTLAQQLRSRQCLPLQRGGLKAPSEGVFLEDGDLPKQLLAKLRDSLSLAAEPPPTPAAQHWPKMLEALGLRGLSSVSRITVQFAGEAKGAMGLAKAVAQMLAPAQRYLVGRHRAIYEALEADLARKLECLQVREVEPPLKILCSVGEDIELEIDCHLETRMADGSPEVRLLLVAGASLATICVELARLLVPAAKETAHAREALTTFLASVSAGAGDQVCAALQLPSLEDAGVSPWPVPKEVAEQLEAEQRLLDAQAEEPEKSPAPQDAEPSLGPEEVFEPPTKRQRTETEAPEAALESVMVEASRKLAAALEDPDLPEMDTAAEGAAEAESTSSAELQLEVEASQEDQKDADALLKNVSVGEKEGAEGEEGDGKGKGKGKSKGKGKDGADAKGRKATELGEVLAKLPAERTTEEGSEAPEAKKRDFKTRVYDLEDLRAQGRRSKLPPLPHENTLSQEAREQVGRWGEEFVYNYLKSKLESEEGGKRVVWVNEVEETGFQYDLRIEDSGSGEVDAYVEVKTSRAKDKQLFEMSYREWTFAQKEGGKFLIFRVSNAGKEDVELCSISNPFRQWKELNLGLCLTL
ncbi:unnamed protein product [Effrenium voratum]|nr:unnamed protein product [Effrenium voratum]